MSSMTLSAVAAESTAREPDRYRACMPGPCSR